MRRQLVRCEAARALRHGVAVFVLPFAAGCVQRKRKIAARRIAGAGDGLQNQLDRLRFAFQIRCKAAFIADSGTKPALFEQRRQRVINLCAHAQRAAEGFCAAGNNHELLNIQIVSRMYAAVDDVHHRHG